MIATPKPPEELCELVGLELNRRRLVKELMEVHVAIAKLQHQMQERGIEPPWINAGCQKPIAK